MSNISDEIIKTIKFAFSRYKPNCDITYTSIIKEVTEKGYVILDRAGNERTVKCCIPGAKLNVRQMVYVKEPMGKLNDIHICGVK